MSGKQAAKMSPIPTKWAVAIVGVLIVYTLLQPVLNRRFGWQLPSLGSSQQSPSSEPESLGKGTPKSESNIDLPPLAQAPEAKSTVANTNENLKYGLLRETAPDDYVSPGGLRYTRGSAEGHRLAHLERHLEDDPGRPGKHGVFNGDMPQVIRWLDEAYANAKRGAKGTSKSVEEGRTVYEVSFSKPIGFVGGRDGKRDRNPDAQRIRLVLDGNKVVTAFPF